jgi:hypothetical protein
MKNNSMVRGWMGAAPVIVCSLLVSGASAMAQSAVTQSIERRCSDRTLFGNYGFALEGEILGPGIQFRGVVMQHYDGRGNLRQVDHVVTNGMPPTEEWTPGKGTYTVNPNCTGTAVINIPGNPLSPINLHFVVVRGGKEIRQVVDANAVTAVGIKVE